LVAYCVGTALKHVTEGKIKQGKEVTGRPEKDVSSDWMTLGKSKILETERRSARSY
jgi:hypothetical protein